MKHYLISIIGVLTFFSVGFTSASPLLLDRGLPDQNLNKAAGGDRSNINYDFAGFGYFAGDDFTLQAGNQYQVDTVRFWLNPSANGAAAANNNSDVNDDLAYGLSDTYESFAFYLGDAASSSVPVLEQANFTGGNTTDNANVSIRRALYQGSEFDYQGSSENYLQTYEVTLSNLGLILDGGTTYQFGTECRGSNETNANGNFTTCFLHGANQDLAGSPQQGSDDYFRVFSVGDDLSQPASFAGTYNSDRNGTPGTAGGGGWDKPADMNIQVFGSAVAVPEPSSLGILSLGLIGLGLSRQRRRHEG
ncbi:MAG: PEP-CTERM sorting domain-containing protein [Marinobacter sp.]|nr:PEP-CTERM sorting domain-containing protein [Marinobacter sp.]